MKVSMILICSDAGEKAHEVRRDALAERRDLAVEFIFCLVLVEVLKQLPFHPGHNDLCCREWRSWHLLTSNTKKGALCKQNSRALRGPLARDESFPKYFFFPSPFPLLRLETNPNGANMHLIADLYAEVVGVLVQSRFHSVRQRFMTELKELRSKEPGIHTTQSVQALLMGMKFFRVKVWAHFFTAKLEVTHLLSQY